MRAARTVLAQRSEARRQGSRDLSDADTAMLTRQLASADALTPAEQALALPPRLAIRHRGAIAAFESPAFWRPVLELMQRYKEAAAAAMRATCRT